MSKKNRSSVKTALSFHDLRNQAQQCTFRERVGHFSRFIAQMQASREHYYLREIVSPPGRVVDLMDETAPETFWQTHGVELTLAALFVLFLRPLAIVLNHFLLEQTLAGNMQDQVGGRISTCSASRRASSRTTSPGGSRTG